MSKRKLSDLVVYSDETDSDYSFEAEPRVVHRIRKMPKRFGEPGNISIDDSDTSPCDDDSMTDKNYVPSPKKPRRDFNRKFEMIRSNNRIENVDIECGEMNTMRDIGYGTNTCFQTNSNEQREVNRADNRIGNVATDKLDLIKMQDSNSVNYISRIIEMAEKQSELVTLIHQLNGKINETLARVAIMEQLLLKNNTRGNNIELSRTNNDLEVIDAFSKSNRLPLMNIDDTNVFEKNLDDSNFAKIAVSWIFEYYLHQRFNTVHQL